MGLADRFRQLISGKSAAAPRASGESNTIWTGDLNDPRFKEFLQSGGTSTESGAIVTPERSMRVTAVQSCVRLISRAAGMLPLPLYRSIAGDDSEKATDHPLYRVLYRKPNRWQTASEFRSMLQAHALLRGNGYAFKVKGAGGISELIPLNPDRMDPQQNADLTIAYNYTRKDGSRTTFRQADIFHLRDLSNDGVVGSSVIRQAAEAIGAAMQSETASSRMYKHGVFAGGALQAPNALSKDAYERLRESMEKRHEGAENTGRWLILEEGLTAATLSITAADMQFIESRRFSVEDIARIFGVPPHMIGAVDKATSWGSGIENQTIGFVIFTLQPWLTTWEQAIARDCLTDAEAETYFAKHNLAALLRGNSNDRANYFKAALGAPGSKGWMTQNEVRRLDEMNKSTDEGADSLAPIPSVRENIDPNQGNPNDAQVDPANQNQ